MLRAWAKPFGPLAKAIFHPLSSGTGIIRSNHAIQISTLRTEAEGAELLPPLSRKGGSLEERRDVSPRSLLDPFFKCLGLLHDTYDLRTQLWFSHGLKRQEVRRVLRKLQSLTYCKAKSVPPNGAMYRRYISYSVHNLRARPQASRRGSRNRPTTFVGSFRSSKTVPVQY